MSCSISFDDIKAVEPDIIRYRRSIHMHPETGFEEVKTSAMAAASSTPFPKGSA